MIDRDLGDVMAADGYVVTPARSGAALLAHARDEPPELIVLDVGRSGLDALTVCRSLSRAGLAQAISMTARRADPRSRVDRPAASTRRGTGRARQLPRQERLGRLRLDRAGRRAFVDQDELRLSPRLWDLLAYFVTRPGYVFSRPTLLRDVWGRNDMPGKTVDVHIRWLRQQLDRFGSLGFQISTVRGAGYRLDELPDGG